MRGNIGLVALAVMLGAGCSTYELPGALGEQCELNSDCDAPLVCRLGYCRVECASARDCAAGSDCIYDNEQRGSCQLPEDLGCTNNSQCHPQLVCTMGECTNPCNCPPDVVPCRDCPPGAACIDNAGARACLDTSTTACVFASDCPILDAGAGDPMFEVCASDQRCRVECPGEEDIGDLYCRNGETCEPVMFLERRDGGEQQVRGFLCIFTGAPDGGVSDGGPSDGGTVDGGVADGGGMDGG